ncbi:hypothetical protein BWI17_13080 [Betaproteobacteria bacterium GR16-43]|nr:hypothetical protein BWI17_13080 [Betaproteobacteria bacterium GR16-43]
MAQAYLGEIRIFAGAFAPQGWMFCDGTVLSIVKNTPLFAVIGTTYGGDGIQNFALPDLRDRVPVGVGRASGLANRVQGETGGSAAVALTDHTMGAHDHRAQCFSGAGNHRSPRGRIWAQSNTNDPPFHTPPALAPMNAAAVGTTGGGQPHANEQPFLAVNFIIAVSGDFPRFT